MTPIKGTSGLQNILQQKIQQKGPITLYEYMSYCLYGPAHGYYMQHVPMGKDGDFITAPEISQLFGEMIGILLLQTLENFQNQQVTLMELGPGRGVLMADILRTFQLRPKLLEDLNICMVEISPLLKKIQQEMLKNYSIQWHQSLNDVLTHSKGKSLLCVANEFLDALPLDQYKRLKNQWYRCHVEYINSTFSYYWIPSIPPEILPTWTEEDVIYEYAPDAKIILEKIRDYLHQYGGILILIDYGYTGVAGGDTLQALKNHQYVSPLSYPGTADITAHVNFDYVQHILSAGGCKTYVCSQKDFLLSMGIRERHTILKANVPKPQQEILERQFNHLTEKMGDLFKVLIVQQDSPAYT